MAGDIRILIVDDDPSVRDSLGRWFRDEGCEVDVAGNAKEALRKLGEAAWDVFLLDIRMPGMDGLELQQHILAVQPDATIIVMTAYASVDSAVRAMRQGAHDYITKPFDPDAVERLARTAVERRRLQRQNEQLKRAVAELEPEAEIVGDSPAMRNARRWIEAAGSSDGPILIVGERGTGRETVARAIHARSVRRYMPFVTLGTALAGPELEAEMLGLEQGPGGRARRRGKLELADGGTLFVDGIAGLGPKAQEDLLRAVEDKAICRLGAERRIPVDFRPIAAAEREPAPGEPGLRPELLERLAVVTIRLPPLRERREDIEPLAEQFLRRCGRKMNRLFQGFSSAALQTLREAEWPGNVRQLQIAVERAAVLKDGGIIDEHDLRPDADLGRKESDGDPDEIARIRGALAAAEGNLAVAAGILGVDRADLFERMKRLGVERTTGK
ncbi:MAG: sigma-54-dependent Fis family transcriptional regulator [Deltaproteobacteria bacterium]|nr:sigma-54-dependent Fis family transcriptional regulator [Deltaproteobacteria bacterium]